MWTAAYLGLSLASLVACSATAQPPADDDAATDSAELSAPSREEPALACALPAAGAHAKCDGTTVHKGSFQVIQPALETGTDDRAKAEEICGKYLATHGVPLAATDNGRCGACPKGSDGCKPGDFKMTSGFQRDPVSGHWTCGGTNAPAMTHTCTRCVINGMACDDVAAEQQNPSSEGWTR